MMLFGFLFLVIGFALPFLMVIHLVEPTLELNFFAYMASLLGVVVGLIGAVSFSRERQRKDDSDEH